jgi:hypothetical protein
MERYRDGLHIAGISRRRVIGALAAAPLAALLLAGGVAVGADEPTTITFTPGAPGKAPDGPVIHLDKVSGTVTGASGGTLTVRQSDGTTATVTTNDATGAMQLKAGGVGDLHVGDTIAVTGDKTSDTAFTAKEIMRPNLPKGAARAVTKPVGTPPADGAKVGYVQIAAGITPDGSALPAPSAPPPPGDGKNQIVIFTVNGDGAKAKAGVFGEITAINGATITIRTPDDKTISVATDASTTVTEDAPGAVTDIAVGDTVTAIGQKNGGDLTARSITYRHAG